jgi:hypothetical protein
MIRYGTAKVERTDEDSFCAKFRELIVVSNFKI